MRTPHRLLALTAVAAVAVGGAWLAPRWLAPAYSGPSVALAAETAAASPVAESPVAESPVAESSVPMIAPEALGEPRETTREVVPEPSPNAAELPALKVPADAIWVEGRVIFPRDTPPDEHVRVVTRGRTFPGTKKRRTHEVELAADGSFRAAFAPKTRTGYVRLEAHYLYLEKSVKVDARELPSEVLLEPQLGARVLLTVTPPAGADPGDLDEVSVQGWVVGVRNEPIFMPREVTEHENGVFDLSSLRIGGSLHTSVTAPAWCNRILKIDGLRAGEMREVTLALTLGARLTGRTLDDNGAPVQGVQIWATTESSRTDFIDWTMPTTVHSDDDGGFDLRGVESGVVFLQAKHSGLLERTLELGNLEDGDVRQGLVLRMGQGGVVSGLVQWPDGRPVAGARVEVQQDLEEDDFVVSFGPDSSVKSDADGRFRVTGLGDGICTVRARARPAREKSERQGLLERRRSGLGSKRSPYWRVTLEDVLPSGSELVLVLRSGGAVSGRVVDDAGNAVEKFKVRVKEPGAGRFHGFGMDKGTSLSDTFKSKDGRFVLEGVPEGEWIATASARGYGASGAMPVNVPQSGELMLVVPREATVAGVVLDPDGRPLSGVQVHAQQRHDSWSSSKEMEEDRTGKDGSFELSLAPGRHEIHAAHDTYADSVPQTLEVAPAETREGLVFTLRRPARIIGALDPSVGELAGREVYMYNQDSSEWDEVMTDNRGRFAFEGLAPGTIRLSLQETRELAGDGRGSISISNVVSSTASLTLELREGEERQVVLGVALAIPVRVSGLVTAAGTPVSGLSVTWHPLASDDRDERVATTDESGRYELDVDGTGPFMVVVDREGQAGTRLGALVPEDASTFVFDVELPTAHVSGRLVGPDGEPVGEAHVALESQDEDSHVEFRVQSAEDGSFLFEHVKPGTYELRASDTRYGFSEETARFAVRRLRDLEVLETGIDGLELRLLRSASIEGSVLHEDGSLASHCIIYVTDEQGRSIGSWSAA